MTLSKSTLCSNCHTLNTCISFNHDVLCQSCLSRALDMLNTPTNLYGRVINENSTFYNKVMKVTKVESTSIWLEDMCFYVSEVETFEK